MKLLIKVPKKIIWRKDLSKKTEESFYPSFIKKINKAESFLRENFEIIFCKASENEIKNEFLPNYERLIAERENYNLDFEKVSQKLIEKSKNKLLEMLKIKYKSEIILGAILSKTKDNAIQIGHFFSDREKVKHLTRDVSLDYWSEKLIFDYSKEKKYKFLSYGKDKHPYFSSEIGLALYKLKTGARPRLSLAKEELVEIDKRIIFSKGVSLIFFDDPDENGFLKKCLFYCPKKDMEKFSLKGLRKIMNWAGLEFFSNIF